MHFRALCTIVQNAQGACPPVHGKVASDTHSLLFCAAFHGIVNFSKHGLLSDTAYLTAFIGVIVFWVAIWYFISRTPWGNMNK